MTGAERQQTDHRADLQALRRAVGQAQQVVEEAVLLVPHLVVVLAHAVHGGGDPEEVLEELAGDLLVDRVVVGASSSAISSMFWQ